MENYENKTDNREADITSVNDSMQKELVECQEQLVEWRGKYIQALADLENIKKRASKDYEIQRDAIYASIVKDLLSIVDDFDRALEQPIAADLNDSFRAGIEMIRGAFGSLLNKYGVEEMAAVEHFDPLIHEAVAQVEIEGKESGSIAMVLQKGYMMHGKVLRPARVSVVK